MQISDKPVKQYKFSVVGEGEEVTFYVLGDVNIPQLKTWISTRKVETAIPMKRAYKKRWPYKKSRSLWPEESKTEAVAETGTSN